MQPNRPPKKMVNITDLLKAKVQDMGVLDGQQAKKNITQEFQDYGMRLAFRLDDTKHKALYIKYSKAVPRAILEDAAAFASDYPKAQNKGKIFMWKLHELLSEYVIDHPEFKIEWMNLRRSTKKKKEPKANKPKVKKSKVKQNPDQTLLI